MADQSDVEQALAAAITAAVYPAALAGASATGAVIRVYRGWPDPVSLDHDLLAGTVNVSVSAEPHSQTTTTRYPDEWQVAQQVTPTLEVSVDNDTALFAGDAGPGQIAGILVDGMAAVHRTIPGDTPYTVAVALATALVSRNALGKGAAVQVIGARGMVARVVADQPAAREIRRQREVFRIACWCPDPSSRDATAGAVDVALAQLNFLALPDGLSGRLRYVSSAPSDRAQAAALYRRDLLYSVDYATSVSAGLPTLIFGNAAASAAAGTVTTNLS